MSGAHLLLIGVVLLAPVTRQPTQQKSKSPMTAPATQPNLTAAEAEADQARARVTQAVQQSEKRLAATAEYKKLSDAESTAKKALDKARAGGSAKDRLAASQAFIKARDARAAAVDIAREGDPEVQAARAALANAVLALVRAKLADARATKERKEIQQKRIELPQEFKDGAVGRINVRVVEVVDATNVVAEALFGGVHHLGRGRYQSWRDEKTFWLTGYPTKGLVDGAQFELLVEVKGTKRYETVAGSASTVLLAKPHALAVLPQEE